MISPQTYKKITNHKRYYKCSFIIVNKTKTNKMK